MIATTKVTWIPLAFSLHGEAGQELVASRDVYTPFRGEQLFAIDTVYCRGTEIASSMVGTPAQVKRFVPGFDGNVAVPTWAFSEWVPPHERRAYEHASSLVGTSFETADVRRAQHALRLAKATEQMKWPTANPGEKVYFKVRFLQTCAWQAVLWGISIL